jgi:hypothetical protein
MLSPTMGMHGRTPSYKEVVAVSLERVCRERNENENEEKEVVAINLERVYRERSESEERREEVCRERSENEKRGEEVNEINKLLSRVIKSSS